MCKGITDSAMTFLLGLVVSNWEWCISANGSRTTRRSHCLIFFSHRQITKLDCRQALDEQMMYYACYIKPNTNVP